MHVPNLHTAPKKIWKIIWKKINLQDVLKGLNLKFLEILHSNKTPNIYFRPTSLK